MKLVYIDLETTGIPFPESGVIQLAGAVEIDGQIKEQFDYRISPFPCDVISDEALALNGVTREELADRTDPREVFRSFTHLLSKYVDRYNRSDKLHFIGYNAQFDADHLRAWFEKNDDKYFGSWFFHPPLDVMGMAAIVLMRKRAGLSNFKLPTVAKALGFPVDESQTHDALYDVMLTRDLFLELLERVRPA